jgi:hypothetical protein
MCVPFEGRSDVDAEIPLAWWSPFPLNDCTNAALLSHHLRSRERVQLCRAWHTHFPNSSIPTSSLVSLQRLLQKARVPGFPGHMRMGYRRMWKLRCVGLSMFRGAVNGARRCGR